MDAVITAGGIPLPEEPLYPYTQGHSKAMLDVAGKPMVQWALDALGNARSIENVILVGLTEKSGLVCSKPVYYIPNQGRMLDNFRAGVRKSMEINRKNKHVLMVSSDIPAITGEMVDWVVETAMQTDDDIYYNVISREVMEKRFPGSKRTYTRLKDIELCGGDMNVARSSLVVAEDESGLWQKISDSRKSPLKQAALIGYGTLFQLLFRRLTLEMAAGRIMKKLDITGRAIVCPPAEVGMDVDKPHQLELLRDDLKKQQRKAARLEKKKPVPQKAKKTVKKTATKTTRK